MRQTPDEKAEDAADAGYKDLMVMIRGETVPANVLSIDGEYVHAATPFAEMTKIPMSEVVALELKSSGSLSHHGFGGDWNVLNSS